MMLRVASSAGSESVAGFASSVLQSKSKATEVLGAALGVEPGSVQLMLKGS